MENISRSEEIVRPEPGWAKGIIPEGKMGATKVSLTASTKGTNRIHQIFCKFFGKGGVNLSEHRDVAMLLNDSSLEELKQLETLLGRSEAAHRELLKQHEVQLPKIERSIPFKTTKKGSQINHIHHLKGVLCGLSKLKALAQKARIDKFLSAPCNSKEDYQKLGQGLNQWRSALPVEEQQGLDIAVDKNIATQLRSPKLSWEEKFANFAVFYKEFPCPQENAMRELMNIRDNLKPEEREKFDSAFVKHLRDLGDSAVKTIISSSKNILPLILQAISAEVKSTAQATALFRLDSLTTKLIREFAINQRIGKKIFTDPKVQQSFNALLTFTGKFDDIDGTFRSPQETGKNQEKFTDLTLTWMKDVLEVSAKRLKGSKMAYIFTSMHENTRKQFGDKTPHPGYANLFLRLLTPSVSSPHMFGLATSPPASKELKVRVLLSKVLQNHGNNVLFGHGGKEPGMMYMNARVLQEPEIVESKKKLLEAFQPFISGHRKKKRLN